MKKKLFFYEASFVEDITNQARELFLARDAYIKAWCDFHNTPIGCFISPDDEVDAMRRILEEASHGKE